MSTTNQNKVLTVTLSAKVGSDNLLESKYKVPNINEVSRRILTVPILETDVLLFSNVVGSGTFISDNLKFASITNLDDTNFLRIRRKKTYANRIATLGAVVAGSGYLNGTYNNIPLVGTGTGATATFIVAGTAINSLGGLTAGSGYVNGVYNGVALTGSTGTGATGNITVAGGVVTSVVLVARGTGYTANTSLSASNVDLGGTGTGFLIQIINLQGGVSTITLGLKGKGYALGESLTAANNTIGNGTGFSVLVGTVDTISETVDEKLEAGKFIVFNNTKLSVDEANAGFSSFVDIETVSAQADTLPIDIEIYVASI